MRAIISLFLVFIIGCSISNQPVNEIECSTDKDCAVGGCSSQLCGVKGEIENIITTCEFKEEYRCLELTNCGCVSNKCQWEENNEYVKCLSRFESS